MTDSHADGAALVDLDAGYNADHDNVVAWGDEGETVGRTLQVIPGGRLGDQPEAAPRDHAMFWEISYPELQKYLNGQTEPTGRYPRALVDRVRSMWLLCRETEKGLPLPTISGTAEGLELSWSSADLRLGIEVRLSDWDWFFRDRSRDIVEGADEHKIVVARDLRDRLKRLVDDRR